MLECAGVHDVLAKSLGSANAINVVHATVAALQSLEQPEQVARRRGPVGRAGHPGRDPAGPRGGERVVTQLLVKQIRSGVGGRQNQRDTLRTLGLRKIGDTSIREDRPEVRGMINTVAHLVTVEEVS